MKYMIGIIGKLDGQIQIEKITNFPCKNIYLTSENGTTCPPLCVNDLDLQVKNSFRL